MSKILFRLCPVIFVGVGCGSQPLPDWPKPVEARQNTPGPKLTLVSARDHLPGSLLGNQAVYADSERIYLATYQGNLFVLRRDQTADFPLIQTISLGLPLNAVLGDKNNLYVLAADGQLRTFRKTFPLQLATTTSLVAAGLHSIALIGGEIYVSTGQAEMAVDKNQVYLSVLNEGEVGLRLSSGNLTDLIYGQVFQFGLTVVYDRQTGVPVGSLPNPAGSQVTLTGDRTRLFQTVAGCCGTGIGVFDKSRLALEQFIPRAGTNTVASANQPGEDLWLSGTEWGGVELFDLDRPGAPVITSLDLRSVTGHTGPEDIEIRALWADGLDHFVFAGSSWGNDLSRGPDLPSFFVLELK